MTKGKKKALFFWAAWDKDFFKKINDFKNECHILKIPYELIDVETEGGVRASVKYGVRNVPTIVVVGDNKVVGVERGNRGYKELCKYSK